MKRKFKSDFPLYISRIRAKIARYNWKTDHRSIDYCELCSKIKQREVIFLAKVYIVNKSIHDYSAAKEYGDLVFLSEGNMDRFSTSKAYRKFIPILEYSSEDDFLMVSGMSMLCIVAAFILGQRHDRLNLLLFKPKKGGKKEYLERIILADYKDDGR